MDSHIKHGCQRLKPLSLRDKNSQLRLLQRVALSQFPTLGSVWQQRWGGIPYMVITYSSDEHRCPAHQIFCLWATGIQKCGQHGGVVVSTVSSQALGLSPDWGFSVWGFYILFRYSGFLPQSWGEVTMAAEIGSGILNWRSSIRWIEEIKRKSV